jgi:hypothetical protein
MLCVVPRWAVLADVTSRDLALAAGWLGFWDSDAVPPTVERMGSSCFDEGAGIRAWFVVALEAVSEADASREGRLIVEGLLAACPDQVRADPGLRVTVTSEPRSAWPRIGDDTAISARVPGGFLWTTTPVRLSEAHVSSDERTVVVEWIDGHQPVAWVDIDETRERVTVVVHETHAPSVDRDGNVYAEELIRRLRCARVELAEPLGGRELRDGCTRRTVATIRESSRDCAEDAPVHRRRRPPADGT